MSDAYADNMGRDGREAKRLGEQFDLLTENIGYILHPDITANLSSTARVADIGTGTGVFLQRLHTTFPNLTLDGSDISTALFPPSSCLPPNITLQQHNIKQPFPQELHGNYDVVHVRMLAAGMLHNEWTPAVRNVVMLLKPGGWLQWEECDFSSVKHLRGRAGSSVETARKMGVAFRTALKERFENGWDTLPADMRAAGLEAVDTDLLSSDQVPRTREALSKNGIQAIFSWARVMAERGVPGAMGMGELGVLERKAYEDIESGCYSRFDVYVTRGRKEGGL